MSSTSTVWYAFAIVNLRTSVSPATCNYPPHRLVQPIGAWSPLSLLVLDTGVGVSLAIMGAWISCGWLLLFHIQRIVCLIGSMA